MKTNLFCLCSHLTKCAEARLRRAAPRRAFSRHPLLAAVAADRRLLDALQADLRAGGRVARRRELDRLRARAGRLAGDVAPAGESRLLARAVDELVPGELNDFAHRELA